ncbi:MAG TPA: transglycosylase domain-containing protein [Rickettsiales bacterium]|nr:transglycosylase domain-containing protein [Rickettsiales bacterium]
MRRAFAIASVCLLVPAVMLAVATWMAVKPLDAGALNDFSAQTHFDVVDRSGAPLAVSYRNALNDSSILPLYSVPSLLQQAFIAAEDKRFFSHHGVDWLARLAAVRQDIKALHGVRGASTITEQVVRILHPRPRTLWSRWVEGFEAMSLERHAAKAQILEFYLNQVPYAANRRGIVQAARYYFNREVATLTPKEMLALAVLPRAPSAYDLYAHPGKITPALLRLATAMHLPEEETASGAFALGKPALPVSADHFVSYIRQNVAASPGKLTTTLDAHIQQQAQQTLDALLRGMKRKQAHNAAAMIVDHETGEILAWVTAGDSQQAIDAVLTPRQPGSSMKPLLYALALDSGWTAATIIPDEPITQEINDGMHRFRNYSHTYYGKVTLREALGNSLNIPAIHTIDHVGVARYLATLHRLGMESLTQPADFYDEGLALGDGEVTLFEMMQAYAALAHRGVFRPLTALLDSPYARPNERIYSEEAASLIGNILSDPWAKRLEFGTGSMLNLPVQTAAKTGTSTDYHDAWAMGYNSHYVVGIWMGNLDGKPMDGVTGSSGPAIALRSIFAALTERIPTAPLYLSPRLVKHDICTQAHDGSRGCFMHSEYFIAGTEPTAAAPIVSTAPHPALVRPVDGLYLAYDPRVPANKQAFEFVAQGISPGQQAGWKLNGKTVAVTDNGHYLWPLQRGDYQLVLEVAESGGGQMQPVDTVSFHVK